MKEEKKKSRWGDLRVIIGKINPDLRTVMEYGNSGKPSGKERVGIKIQESGEMSRYFVWGVYSQIVLPVFHRGLRILHISCILQYPALQKESRVPHQGILSWFIFAKLQFFLARSECCDL